MSLPKIKRLPGWHWLVAAAITSIVVLSVTAWGVDTWDTIQEKIQGTAWENQKLKSQVTGIAKQLNDLQQEDQYVKNKQLAFDIGAIESTYTNTVAAYEDLLNLKDVSRDTKKFDAVFADILSLLAKRDYKAAATKLTSLRADISTEQQKIAATFTIPANVPSSNAPPGSGYSRQTVNADIGMYLVDLIAADLGSTHVYVDTASGATCTNSCPVMSLGDYVARSGAYAGVNGSYFCPADYPSCAGKVNAFDTLLMNKNKAYFNSDNNVYSTVPAVIFGNGFVRFVGRSLEWGRDTGIDSMIANQPLLLSGGNIAFGGNGDPKMGSKGSRGFVGNRGNTVFIGVVHNVTVAESAHVLKALGMENALNLDSGGSVALWSGGYKVGPGRNIPNAILFVKK